MVKTIKEYDGKWMVWNKETGKVADIVRINEGGYLASSKKRYRVDVSGKTVASMVDSYQKALGIAKKAVN